MRIIVLYTLTTLVFTTLIFSQNEQLNLAKIGSEVITKDEFLARYELTPQLYRENKKIKDELKQEFLYSLIAEKLLSLYGDEIYIDTTAVVKKTLKIFEEMFVRDALYKKEIVDKAKAKADSLLSFYLANANNVSLIYIRSENESEINNIYNLLKKGVPFDSLYTELNSHNEDTLTISVGQLAENIEDKIFPLPDDAFTPTIEMNRSWYIFKILKRYNPIILKSLGWENDFKKSQKLAKERAERDFYKVYMEKFFKDKQVKINGKLLKSFSTHLFAVLKSRVSDNQKNEKIYLMSVDIPLIEYQLGKDTLALTFVEMSDRNLNAEDFLNYLRFENFNVDSLDYYTILNSLSIKTKDFIEYKMLADEGYRQGLQSNSAVKNQMKMWKDNYFMQLVTTKFIDSAKVSDQEIIDFYNEQKNGKLRNKQVNILQFYSDSLETVEKFLNEIESGKNFEDLLKKYSSNQSSKTNNGESGFITANSNGEVGRIAASMKIGDIYGPMPFKNGYLVFKLLDVKEDSASLSKDFAELKNELVKELGYLKQKKSINKFIGDLANKYGLQVNLDNLKNIAVTSHQSIIYRYLGFGGRILAVPLVNINMEWVPEWQGSSQNIQ
ncbi:MAG TPA: hypothetical protein DHV28_16030 [Ignavibacteriales bacterium]|nr:hypothetical protein [Ignavibacteriales bacterium]